MRCRKRGVHSRYIENSKFMNGLNGKHKNGGGLDLSSLLNKRRGFEQVATNDIDADDLDSADSDIEEFSLTATKV
ncbi:hypothetical protein Anas_03693 [Armadillidium nasatum]|uniref:Uncharacterized protein n=1 Tax=Armadillidium nasatum TaxID=96803 RepID=A0A5N5SR56_9CRUS|nr:hypothetical protein Anas_03693 [Armadillidium nasatum]